MEETLTDTIANMARTGRPKTYTEKTRPTESVYAKVTIEVKKKLEDIAEREERSVAQVIARILRDYQPPIHDEK